MNKIKTDTLNVIDDDELEKSKVFNVIDLENRADVIEADGVMVKALNGNYNRGTALRLLERFVADVIKGNLPPFKFSTNKFGFTFIEKLPLGNYCRLMPSALSLFSDRHDFSVAVEAFFETAREVGYLQDGDISFEASRLGIGFELTIGRAQSFCHFVDLLRARMNTKAYRQRLVDRKKYCLRQLQSSKKLIDAVFSENSGISRHCVVRVDLGYTKETRRHITSAQVKSDMARFINNMRGKPALFRHKTCYFWKIEYGYLRRYHTHWIFMFDGAYVQRDQYYADQIGRYWVKVTNGRGNYFNCNSDKKKYANNGIGMVNHDDEVKRRNLVYEAVKYLVKTDQYYRVKQEDIGHSFGHSIMPRPRRSRAGRPRKSRDQ